jgi:large subunit ribosomal protein L17
MRHRKKAVKLSRKPAHVKSMLKNMVCSLVLHGQIKTTKTKAKAVRSLAEKVMHLAISGNDTHTRRRVFQLLDNKEAVKHLFDEVAGRFSKNNGGYTKIVPFGNAKGDNSEQVFFMLSYDVSEKDQKKSTIKFHFKKKKGERKKSDTKAAPESAETQEEKQEEAAEETPEAQDEAAETEKEEETEQEAPEEEAEKEEPEEDSKKK